MTDAIILDMDESREIKWTFGAIKSFEKRGREILKRLDFKNERGQAVASTPMHAGFMLANFVRVAEIQEAAIAAATGLSGLEGKKGEASEASAAIDAYLQKGGDIETLQNEIYRAYLVTADPSSISGWEESRAREAEIKRINREMADANLEEARRGLALAQEKIARQSGGSTLIASPTSS